MSRAWDKAKTGIKVGAIAGAVAGGLSGAIGGTMLFPGLGTVAGLVLGAIEGAVEWGAVGGIVGGVYGGVTKDKAPKSQDSETPVLNAKSAYAQQDMTPDLSSTKFQEMARAQGQRQAAR